METKKQYNVALLDGDLLILTPSTIDMTDATSYNNVDRNTPAQPPNSTIQSILERVHKRESELPYLLLPWAE